MKTTLTQTSAIQNSGCRLDASYHASPGVQALHFLQQWANHATPRHISTSRMLREEQIAYRVGRRIDLLQDVCKPNGIFIPYRFKRIYVDDPEYGVPYLTGGNILQVDPLNSAKFLAKNNTNNLHRLALQERMILITCSGMIGNCIYVNSNFQGAVGSPDLIRILADTNKISSGYLYAYLSSPLARTLIEQKTYGAVVPHIEAHHVFDLPIPRLEADTEQRIHRLIEQAAQSQVEATTLLLQARTHLQKDVLNIELSTFQPKQKITLTQTSSLHSRGCRLDASYHASSGVRVLHFLRQWASQPTEHSKLSIYGHIGELAGYLVKRRLDLLKDVCEPNGIFIPKRFKRIYVDNPEHGVPYLTGSDILKSDPTNDTKFLSKKYTSNLEELALQERIILITCSGIIGNCVYVNSNFQGTVGSPDLIRVLADTSKILPGYLYAYLSSSLGRVLIEQKTYGAVIPHIEAHHILDLPIPRSDYETEKCIHDLIEQASQLRVKARNLFLQAQVLLMHEIDFE